MSETPNTDATAQDATLAQTDPADVEQTSVPEEQQDAENEGEPRLYADKFDSVDGLVEGYKSLEQKLGEQSNEIGELRKTADKIAFLEGQMTQINQQQQEDASALTPEQREQINEALLTDGAGVLEQYYQQVLNQSKVVMDQELEGLRQEVARLQSASEVQDFPESKNPAFRSTFKELREKHPTLAASEVRLMAAGKLAVSSDTAKVSSNRGSATKVPHVGGGGGSAPKPEPKSEVDAMLDAMRDAQPNSMKKLL